MTLRGVIKGLLTGSGDAEAMLADDGYGDLPPEMFSQALSSYADTAPMEEADALTPVLSQLEEGSPSDVFAVLEEQPLSVGPVYEPADQGLVDPDADTTDDLDDFDELGDFGSAGDVVDLDTELDGVDDLVDDVDPVDDALETADAATEDLDDPFADLVDEATEATDSAEDFEDLFATEPEAGGDDPGDLDLDF